MRKLILALAIIYLGNLRAQQQISTDTSAYIEFIKSKSTDSASSINENGATLGLSRNEAWKVASKYLVRAYGKRNIRRQMPYKWLSYSRYYYFTGTFKHKRSRHGGTFTMIINRDNGAVVYMIHGK